MRHTGCEVLQDVVNRDAHSANARLATAFSRLNGDDVLVTHNVILKRECGGGGKGAPDEHRPPSLAPVAINCRLTSADQSLSLRFVWTLEGRGDLWGRLWTLALHDT